MHDTVIAAQYIHDGIPCDRGTVCLKRPAAEISDTHSNPDSQHPLHEVEKSERQRSETD